MTSSPSLGEALRTSSYERAIGSSAFPSSSAPICGLACDLSPSVRHPAQAYGPSQVKGSAKKGNGVRMSVRAHVGPAFLLGRRPDPTAAGCLPLRVLSSGPPPGQWTAGLGPGLRWLECRPVGPASCIDPCSHRAARAGVAAGMGRVGRPAVVIGVTLGAGRAASGLGLLLPVTPACAAPPRPRSQGGLCRWPGPRSAR